MVRGILLASFLMAASACTDSGASSGESTVGGANTGSAAAPGSGQSADASAATSDGGGLATGGDTGLSQGATGSDTAGTSATGDAQAADASTEATTGTSRGDGGANSDADGGSDGGADAVTTGDAESEPREDLGAGAGSDVITIGDSWMSLFLSGIQQSLVAVSGQPYRTYGVPGTRLLNEAIPGQYADAKQEDPNIQTVVMTGGGNDIIQSAEIEADCDVMGPLCDEQVRMILDRLEALWAEMAADGVQDVVYVQYANPEGMNIDFALPDGDSVGVRCAAVPEPLRCHTLETLDIVMGDIPDGIHPSGAAYDRIGQAVYDLMTEEGMRR